MPYEPLKRRMARAKLKAEKDLRYLGFGVVQSNNRPVCLVALHNDQQGHVDVRLIRICLDEIKPPDRKALARYGDYPREIWIRKEGSERFEIHKV